MGSGISRSSRRFFAGSGSTTRFSGAAWARMGSPGTEFEWCAPDGSCVTTILMPWGYHNVTNLGYAIHWGDVSQMVFNMTLAQKKIAGALDKLKPMANTAPYC